MRQIKLSITAEDRHVATLAALAVSLSLAEAAIPSPLPGVKPGLANIVILLVMYQHGLRTAAWVAVVRLLAGSLLIGTFLAPGFWLAAAGTFASVLAMSIARHLPGRWFGPLTVSLCMAFAHIGGQLMLAKYWLFPEANLLLLMPVFMLGAWLFGAVNGWIVAGLLPQAFASGPAPRTQSTYV